jgi:hypothetical protein
LPKSHNIWTKSTEIGSPSLIYKYIGSIKFFEFFKSWFSLETVWLEYKRETQVVVVFHIHKQMPATSTYPRTGQLSSSSSIVSENGQLNEGQTTARGDEDLLGSNSDNEFNQFVPNSSVNRSRLVKSMVELTWIKSLEIVVGNVLLICFLNTFRKVYRIIEFYMYSVYTFIYLEFMCRDLQNFSEFKNFTWYKSQYLIYLQNNDGWTFWIFQKYSFSRITFFREVRGTNIDSKQFLKFYSAHFGIWIDLC